MKEKEKEPFDLQKTAPLLSAVSKQNPFSVPGNYFSDLDKSVMMALNAGQMVLENEKPVQSFSVPPGYFEQLPLQIQNRMEEPKIMPFRPLVLRPAFALSLAAAFIAVMLITRPALWFNTKLNPDQNALTVDELYRSSYLSELDEHTLIDALESNEQGLPASDNSDSDLENYLLDNHIDLHQLTNEL